MIEVEDRSLSAMHCAVLVMAVMMVAAGIERLMGRLPISASGRIFFWVGSTKSPELSQQIADWYSFSHIIHGFAFYGLFHQINRRVRVPMRWRLIFAVLIEASWELLENSPIIINRYRQTMAQGYNGDTILNSMCDIGCCITGFLLARKFPIWLTITLIIAMEIGVGFTIRDNLTLNIVMLIYPFAGIKRWQLGA